MCVLCYLEFTCVCFEVPVSKYQTKGGCLFFSFQAEKLMKQIGVKNVKLSEYEMSIAAHLVDPLNMHVCIFDVKIYFVWCFMSIVLKIMTRFSDCLGEIVGLSIQSYSGIWFVIPDKYRAESAEKTGHEVQTGGSQVQNSKTSL